MSSERVSDERGWRDLKSITPWRSFDVSFHCVWVTWHNHLVVSPPLKTSSCPLRERPTGSRDFRMARLRELVVACALLFAVASAQMESEEDVAIAEELAFGATGAHLLL